MSLRILAALLIMTALVLPGCGRHLEFEDNFSALFADTVQRPYAAGTTATVSVKWSDYEQIDHAWTASSEDPAVIAILSQGVTPSGSELQVEVQAAGVGDTRLAVTSGGHRVGSVSMRVVEATTLQLLDHAKQKTLNQSEDVGNEVRVVVGQPMAMEARYLSASQERAWGRDLVTWTDVDGLTTWTDAETLGRDAEYLLVQPGDLKAYDLPVRLAGKSQRTLRVVGVAEADIVRIELLPPPEHDAHEGEYVCGGLLAYDAAGNRVYGAPADWTIDGESVGSGDLLCYEYAPSSPASSVTVQVGSTGAQLLVRGKNFRASSTATIGCSVAGAGVGSNMDVLFVSLLFLGCALLLRRVLR